MVILDSQIWKVAFADRSRSFGFLTPVRGIPLDKVDDESYARD